MDTALSTQDTITTVVVAVTAVLLASWILIMIVRLTRRSISGDDWGDADNDPRAEEGRWQDAYALGLEHGYQNALMDLTPAVQQE